MSKSKAAFIRAIIRGTNLLFSLIILALVVLAIFRPDLVKGFVEFLGVWTKSVGNWNYLVIFASSMIESFPIIGVLVPGQQIMLIVAGFYGPGHLTGIFCMAILGAVIGNWVGYALGVRYGEAFFRNYGMTFGIGKTEQRILAGQITKNGAIFVILGKFHNLTRAFVPFLAGSMGMKGDRFTLYNGVGSVIWASAMMTIGIFFISYREEIIDHISSIFLVVLLGVTAYIGIFKRTEFKKYLREKEEEIENHIRHP